MHIDDAKELNVDEVYKTLQNISEKMAFLLMRKILKVGQMDIIILKKNVLR